MACWDGTAFTPERCCDIAISAQGPMDLNRVCTKGVGGLKDN